MKDELELIRRMQKRDSQALSSLYDLYSGAIYGVIFRICKNESQAEDLLQETFLKIWNKSELYNPEKGKFFTWAYRIAKNITLNELRKNDKLIQNEDLSVYKDRSDDAEEKDFLALTGSLKKLEVHHQEAIELVYFEGLTHREAHQKMGVPLGTFKSYIRQALKKLKDTYPKEYFLWWIIIEMIR
ncbi:sigma-70 family RNA polymerase sigma factor [Flavobacteriaceae bacterium R38]|nr:sigma-70 family RNA polymerase sigma factor [Flavobacteriaceae bacterium R38]